MNQVKVTQYAKRKKRGFKKVVLVLSLCVIGLAIIFLAAIPPIIMKDMVNGHVDFQTVYSPEELEISAAKLTLTTPDNLQVVAYEVEAANPKANVILISGIHNPSVTAFFPHAKMLQQENYGSILLEMRAHGDSDGNVICLGYKEYLDVQAVVDYLTQKYGDIPIIVYGLSMGGTTAINSMGQLAEIDGLISMSAYSSWEDAFSDNMINMGAPRLYAEIQKPFVKLYTTLKYGFKSAKISPKNQIKRIGERPALIIHSTEDSQVPFASFERIMENAPAHVESWVRQGDNHLILEEDYFLNPREDKEYAEKIIGFLNNHFGG